MGASCSSLKNLINGEYDIDNLSSVQLKHLQDTVNQELFIIAQNDTERMKIINKVTDGFVEKLTNISDFEKNKVFINEILPEITKLSSYLGLDVGKFNKYFGSYFSVFEKSGVENSQFPLLLQEEAVFNGVSFLLGGNDKIVKAMLASLKGKVTKLKENAESSKNKDNAFISVLNRIKAVSTDVLAVDAIAGSGKTKLVANTILRIAEKMGKDGTTIVTSPVQQMASDIFKETTEANLGQTKSLSLKELYEGIESGAIDTKDVDTYLIDEATLVDFKNGVVYDTETDRYIDEDTREIDNSTSFTKFYNLVKSKNKNAKVLLLGDTGQMSKLKGDKKVIDDTEKIIESANLYKSPLLRASKLEQSFRTSSILLQDAYNKLLNNSGDLLSIKNPLNTEFAVSIKDSNQFLGVKVNNNNIVDEENKKEARLKTIKESFLKEGKKGLTIIESIKSQARSNKGISLIIATDLDLTETELITYLKKDEELKDIFDLRKRSKNPETEEGTFNIDIKVFTKNLSNIQGSEADYVIAEISNEPNANGLVHLPKSADGEEIFVANNFYNKSQIYEALYTLITRGKSFVNVINNTSNVHMQSSFNLQSFGLIEPKELIEDANKARDIYKEIFSVEFDDKAIAEMSSINWNNNNPKEVVPEKENQVPDETDPIIIDNEEELNRKLVEIDSSSPEPIEHYIALQSKLIDEFKSIETSNLTDEAKKQLDELLQEINRLDNVINIKKILSNIGTNNYVINSLSKDLGDIENEVNDYLKNKSNLSYDEKVKLRAEIIASKLNEKNYAYTYFKTKDFTEGGKVSKEEAEELRTKNEVSIIQSLLDDTNTAIDTSMDIKFEILNLKKKNDSSPNVKEFEYFVRREKDDNGKEVLRLYTIAKLDYKGTIKYNLVLTNNISQWTGQQAAEFKTNVTKALGDKDIIKLADKENKPLNKLSSIVELVTAGSIIKSPNNTSLNKFVATMKEDNSKVNFSNNVYTVVDKDSKFRGKQIVFYSYSENIDLDSMEFQKWVEKFVSNDESEISSIKSFYKNNGVNHAIGVLVLDNDNYSLKELIDATKDKRGSREKEVNNFILNNKTTDSSIKTLAYFYLRSKGIENPLVPTEADNKLLNSGSIKNGIELQAFVSNGYFSYTERSTGKQIKKEYALFGDEIINQQKADKLFDDIKTKIDTENSSGMTFFSMLNNVFSDIGSFKLDGDNNLIPVRKGKKDFAKVSFGKMITIAFSENTYSDNFTGRNNKETIEPVVFFDLNGLIAYVENNNYSVINNEKVYDENYNTIIAQLEEVFKTNSITKEGFKVYPDLLFDSNKHESLIIETVNRIDRDLKEKVSVNIKGINMPNVIIKIDKLNNLMFTIFEKAPETLEQEEFVIKKNQNTETNKEETNPSISTIETFSEINYNLEEEEFTFNVKSDNGEIKFISLESFDFEEDSDYIANVFKSINTNKDLGEFKEALVSLIMNSRELLFEKNRIEGFDKKNLKAVLTSFLNGEDVDVAYKELIDKAINCK